MKARRSCRRSSSARATSRRRGSSLPDRHQAPRLAGVQQRQQPDGVHGARPAGRRQPGLRSGLSRGADQHRPAQVVARGCARVGDREHAHVLPGHRPEHHHDHPRQSREAPRVRRIRRPDVLPEQRRHQGSDRPAAGRHRRAADLADHGHQRHRAPGHAGTDRRGGPDHRRDRQGAPRSRHRRRAAGSGPLPFARLRPRAGQLRRSSRCRGIGDHHAAGSNASIAQESHPGEHRPGRPARHLLSPAQERFQHADAGQSAAPHVRGAHRAGEVR